MVSSLIPSAKSSAWCSRPPLSSRSFRILHCAQRTVQDEISFPPILWGMQVKRKRTSFLLRLLSARVAADENLVVRPSLPSSLIAKVLAWCTRCYRLEAKKPLRVEKKIFTNKNAFSKWQFQSAQTFPIILFILGKCYIQFIETNDYFTFGTAIAAFYAPVTVMCVLYWRVWRTTENRQKDLSNLQAGKKNDSHRSNSR